LVIKENSLALEILQNTLNFFEITF
jgi:hypothetical protein